MIVSLKGANGSFVSVGNVQVQPVTSDLGAGVKKAVSTPGTIKASVVPASQAPIATPTLSVTSTNLKIQTNMSIQSIAANLGGSKTFLLPPYHGMMNIIMPSFALHLEPAVANHPVTDRLVVTS